MDKEGWIRRKRTGMEGVEITQSVDVGESGLEGVPILQTTKYADFRFTPLGSLGRLANLDPAI